MILPEVNETEREPGRKGNLQYTYRSGRVRNRPHYSVDVGGVWENVPSVLNRLNRSLIMVPRSFFCVVMCTYNGATYLREQLASSAGQCRLPARLE